MVQAEIEINERCLRWCTNIPRQLFGVLADLGDSPFFLDPHYSPLPCTLQFKALQRSGRIVRQARIPRIASLVNFISWTKYGGVCEQQVL